MVFATCVSAYPRIHFALHLHYFLGEGWSSPLRIRVSAYPLRTTLTLLLGEGWSSPLRSAYPLRTTLTLFLGEGLVFATAYPRIRVSTSHYTYIISRGGVVFATAYPRISTLQGSTFHVTGYSAVTPAFFCYEQLPSGFKQNTNL